jgi:prevent-host-death family protein
MKTVTHREMRNQSGDILRRVADGETIQVTNNGQVAALIVPPGTDPLADLVSRGQVRVARNPPSSLRSIARRKGTVDSQTIVATGDDQLSGYLGCDEARPRRAAI